MKVAVELKDPFSWEDLNEFIILVQDLDGFEVKKTEIGTGGITVILQKKSESKESVTKSRESEREGRIAEKYDSKGWVDLTKKIFYKVEDGELKLAYKDYNDKLHIYGSFPYDKVKEVYDNLPQQCTKKEVVEVCRRIGLKIHETLATYLMRIFSRYVDFDAELEKKGNKLFLIKHTDYSLREENRKKLKIEAETIGQPWKVEG